jgi:hypothetical protein
VGVSVRDKVSGRERKSVMETDSVREREKKIVSKRERERK